tara:strand:- start:527 stop:1447 length:921 start_codon:yes stop_codon:yes gene_type:complete
MGKFDNNKVDGISSLPADDFNKNKTELRNILDKANIISSDTNLGQLAESIAIFAAKGDFYTAQFLNNTYTLTPSLSVYPPSYIDGQKVRFVIPANNTGAVLIKIGTLADIPVKTKEGTDMASGDFKIGKSAIIIYNLANNVFNILDLELNTTSTPVGAVFPSASITVPNGHLECDGSAISRTTYADLFNNIGTSWGVGDGSTTFNIPDLRGEFIRGWDNGKGTDSGRAFASSQLDAFQGHYHQVYHSTGGSGFNQFHASIASLSQQTSIETAMTAADIKTDGVNGTPRTAAETRPRNFALMYIIKY